MASQEHVKNYLAYWLQLGKKILVRNGNLEFFPSKVIEGNRYSQEFEQCWQQIIALEGKDCYLEGTRQTVEQLLTSLWVILPCSRCDMPVPTIDLGVQPQGCPCADLEGWPNKELPAPRSPISNSTYLSKIQQRLNGLNKN
jgi:hypothetical protein